MRRVRRTGSSRKPDSGDLTDRMLTPPIQALYFLFDTFAFYFLSTLCIDAVSSFVPPPALAAPAEYFSTLR
jgi:hypothetical protein